MMKDFMKKWGISSKTMSILTGKSSASIAKYKADASIIPQDVMSCIKELESELETIKARHNVDDDGSPRINVVAIEKAIRKMYRRSGGRKVELLYRYDDNGRIIFSGHLWDWNAFYSVNDLIRNNDFKVTANGETIGTETDLSEDEIETLLACERNAAMP